VRSSVSFLTNLGLVALTPREFRASIVPGMITPDLRSERVMIIFCARLRSLEVFSIIFRYSRTGLSMIVGHKHIQFTPSFAKVTRIRLTHLPSSTSEVLSVIPISAFPSTPRLG